MSKTNPDQCKKKTNDDFHVQERRAHDERLYVLHLIGVFEEILKVSFPIQSLLLLLCNQQQPVPVPIREEAVVVEDHFLCSIRYVAWRAS